MALSFFILSGSSFRITHSTETRIILLQLEFSYSEFCDGIVIFMFLCLQVLRHFRKDFPSQMLLIMGWLNYSNSDSKAGKLNCQLEAWD
jgi:hypothetical protein